MPPDRRRVLAVAAGAAAAAALPVPLAASQPGAHGFVFVGIDGRLLPLADFAGRAVLVVNTASMCGYTHQYEGLQALHARYRDRGFTVLGVPSDDFGGQEPGTAQQIQAFCEGVFGVEFPLADKTAVRGPGAHPFYRWAAETLGPAAAPRWNFHKYLLDPAGRLVAWFPTHVPPEAPQVRRAVEAALPR
jgi:glutathione peroxidase